MAVLSGDSNQEEHNPSGSGTGTGTGSGSSGTDADAEIIYFEDSASSKDKDKGAKKDKMEALKDPSSVTALEHFVFLKEMTADFARIREMWPSKSLTDSAHTPRVHRLCAAQVHRPAARRGARALRLELAQRAPGPDAARQGGGHLQHQARDQVRGARLHRTDDVRQPRRDRPQVAVFTPSDCGAFRARSFRCASCPRRSSSSSSWRSTTT